MFDLSLKHIEELKQEKTKNQSQMKFKTEDEVIISLYPLEFKDSPSIQPYSLDEAEKAEFQFK